MSSLRLLLLGPPRLERDGESVELDNRKALALLAYLAVTGDSHSRDELATWLWPDEDQSKARSRLRYSLWALKKALGEAWLAAERESLGLAQSEGLWLDVTQFQARLTACDSHDHPRSEVCPACLPLLTEAVELYRGDFLAGFTLADSPEFDEWQFFQTESLRRELAGALERLGQGHNIQGEYELAIPYARRWLALDPLHEPAHRQLMELYAQTGQHAAALRQYQECVHLLAQELGVSPQAETSALYERLSHGPEYRRPNLAQRFSLEAHEKNLLGQGSMGAVYRGLDTHTGQPVAIKVLRSDMLAAQPDLIERFVREGEALRQLNHPNIVKLLATVEKEGQHYLIMEYVGGGSLGDLLQTQGSLPIARVLEIGLGLADALTRAHSLNIIHRDLKPGNVLLAEDGSPHLADFGIARLTSRPPLTQTGLVLGTVDYLSPEACQGENLDERTDIWAMGVLLYEMLTGERPFSRQSLPAVMTAILSQPVPDLKQRRPDIPAALAELVSRMLVKDRRQRLPSVRLVGAELEAISQGRLGEQESRGVPIQAQAEEQGSTGDVAAASVALPSFLSSAPLPPSTSTPFVARERELAQLGQHLEAALAGDGRVVFITGEAGQGKTALLAEFARRAQAGEAGLMVASGVCNAYVGIGDPYLPFREVLGMLSGDVEARWTAGVITREQARRLWRFLPQAVEALVEAGPDLIDVFVSGTALLRRAIASTPGGADWLKRLQELAARPKAGPGELEPGQLFEQYTQVLQTLAARQPLLVLLDDLQWTDGASANLLFHLGRKLPGRRLLILGAYRPSEVALGQPAAGSGAEHRHALVPIVNEFKRLFGDIQVDLRQTTPAEGRGFVEALLDSEPNRLGEVFRLALFRRTQGQPLFTVELLREMRQRGDLVQDEAGGWREGPALVWETLPVRVEAVIEQRMGRLEAGLRDLLAVASVEGEEFTAQVVARLQGLSERQALRHLSQELEQRHGLVRERGEVQIGRHRLSRYQFGHILFQQYLYNTLSQGERRLLHGEVAALLEELYEGRSDEIVAQLARHYAEAGQGAKAVEYLLRVGDRARALYAHQEAIAVYQQALTFLKEQGEYERAARTLMKLGLTYHLAFDFRQARQAFDEGFVLWQRAGETQLAVPPAPHALRLNWFDPLTLDLTGAEEIISIEVIGQLFSGLVTLSPELDVVPEVARSWEVLDGGRTYVFHLSDDVYWSDGVPLTAGDFVYAWQRALHPANASFAAGCLFDIKGARAFHQGEISDPAQVGARALDEATLVVDLEGPTSYFPHLLTFAVTYPLPRHVVEAHGAAWTEVENIVTNGPFRLEAWQRGRSMLLSRNPQYHGQFTGNVQQVELSLLPEAEWSATLALYQADGLDILDLWNFPPPEIDRARQRHAGEYVSRPWLVTFWVGFDLSRPPFDDGRVRRAFVLATNRETLADVAMRGYYPPATGGLVPVGMPGHAAGIGLPYDPDLARRLLAAAGYPGGRGFPVVNALGPTLLEPVSQYLQAQWRENLGIESTWQLMEGAIWIDRLYKERPAMFFLGWSADYPDPDHFLRVAPLRFGDVTGWRIEAYDELIERARRVTDQGERMELYRQAERILVEEAVIIPLTYWQRHLLVKPWVRRFPTSAVKTFFWQDVIIEPH